ncbi:hypothetical protein, partial [Anaplasma phagocytophilum]|uniref:hypothetical protein n=1 Tax=Anaplasma phagocytophilum TaxID=948 RepID=UPI0018C86EE4
SASTSQGLDARSASASTSKGLGRETASVPTPEDQDRKAARVYELAPQYVAAITGRSAKKRERIIGELYNMDAVQVLTKILSEELEVAKHNRASGDIERLQEALSTIPQDEKAIRARNPVAVGAKTAIGLPQSESSIKYAASMEKGTGIVPSVLHMKGNAALAGDDNVRGTA